MTFVSDRTHNPFGMSLPCDRAVPGYGDVAADFHVIGDHPGVHGGLETGVPFTGMDWSEPFFTTLAESGLVDAWDPDGGDLDLARTYLSYRYPCAAGASDEADGPQASDDGAEPGEPAEGGAPAESDEHRHGWPSSAEYARLEPFFDAELRAVTAHVLLPVGGPTTAHVLRTYTARDGADPDLDALHARERRGSGFLVLPVKEPADWAGDDAAALVEALGAIRSRDFRQTADLGRYLPGADPYLVR